MNLQNLCNLAISFGSPWPVDTAAVEAILAPAVGNPVLLPAGLIAPLESSDYETGTSTDHAVAAERISEHFSVPRATPSRLSFSMRVQFAFGQEQVRMYCDRVGCHSFVSYWLSLGSILPEANGPYNQSRVQAIYDMAETLFVDGGFLVGLLDTEESICQFDDAFASDVPVNWAFWHRKITEVLPNRLVQQVATECVETRHLANGGVFWRWNEFGEPLVVDTASAYHELKHSISKSLEVNTDGP